MRVDLLKPGAGHADNIGMDVTRTIPVPEASADQVLFSPVVFERLAYLAQDDGVGEESFTGSLRGCFQLRGFGLGFYTRGARPELDPREAGRVETAVREAGREGGQHVLFHVFGVFPGSLLRAAFGGGSPMKRMARAGKQMLAHPASFTVPWTAFLEAEYAAPVQIGVHLFDPLVVSFEQAGESQARVVFIERPADADEPMLPTARFDEQRARFEQLTKALAVIAAGVPDGKGKDDPFGPLKMFYLEREWFGNPRAAVEHWLAELPTELTADAVLAQSANGAVEPHPELPFTAAAAPWTVAPWPDEL